MNCGFQADEGIVAGTYFNLSRFVCLYACKCCQPRGRVIEFLGSICYFCTIIAAVAPSVLLHPGLLIWQVPPGELAERLGVALKLAERWAKEQFYDREDAWAAVSRELYEESMLQIQVEDEDFSRLLRRKFGAHPFEVQDSLSSTVIP